MSDTLHSGQFAPEYLNSIEGFGLQPHRLRLKGGQPVMLIRNLNPRQGLCNGTRLICRRFLRHLIEAEIAMGDRRGNTLLCNDQCFRVIICLYFPFSGNIVYIPRISLSTSETDA